MKEKVIHITTPKARKEHICEVCGKPIAVGVQYLNIAYKRGRKMFSRKTHFGCKENKDEKKVVAIPGVPVTEAQFKQSVHYDTLKMLETFSFRENMNIAFVPLIITEVAWFYALKVVQYAADNRISEVKKLSRTVRALREEYISTCRKDLDNEHINKMEKAAEDFVSGCSKDFTLLFFSLNNELKKRWAGLDFLDMRTNACIAMIMLQLLKEHNKRMDEMMAKRLGNDVPLYRNPINDKLWCCMDAYASPCEFKFEGHVETSMRILRYKFDQIDFEVK